MCETSALSSTELFLQLIRSEDFLHVHLDIKSLSVVKAWQA